MIGGRFAWTYNEFVLGRGIFEILSRMLGKPALMERVDIGSTYINESGNTDNFVS